MWRKRQLAGSQTLMVRRRASAVSTEGASSRTIAVTLRRRSAAQASKGDGPAARVGPFILRGRRVAAAPQDDGLKCFTRSPGEEQQCPVVALRQLNFPPPCSMKLFNQAVHPRE